MLKFWGYIGISLFCSIIVVLAIESPIIGLGKILLGGYQQKSVAVPEEHGATAPIEQTVMKAVV